MYFAVLGPLSVTDDARDVPITAGRDRVVLAMLLLNPGRTVSADVLIDAVWEESPPVTARGQLQTCVSRLRRMLPAADIRTHPEGYAITVGADELDATVFVRLVAEATVEIDPDAAHRLFRQALDLWRGEALSGIESAAVRRAASALDERYGVAVEDWVDFELGRGRDRELLADLTGLVKRFPLRERLRAQLMLALYRLGRQADALSEYRRARDVLDEELGVEPSAVLRDMHRRLLTGEVEVPAARLASVNALPRATADFTGRSDIIDRILQSAAAVGSAPRVEVIDGMAGSGKTTVAVHVARLLQPQFPDAQLFIDLQGHSSKSPIEPAAALVTVLRQAGIAADRIPDDVDERLRLWRDTLATRRSVVVLDNAASTAQVTPLLPTNGAVVVLVTSRRRLVGLDGIRPESLDVLSEPEGVALLTAIVGGRVAGEPDAAVEVVRRCGLLPLAIRLAGSRLAHRPRWRVADLARRLSESALPELAAENRTVASAFALSYGQLPEPARLTFRLLGVHPAERFDILSVAALTDLSPDDAQNQLDDLVDVHLVEEPEPGRYRLHDLVREYARTLAQSMPSSQRRDALEQLLQFVRYTSAIIARRREYGVANNDFPVEPPKRADLVEAAVEDARWFETLRPELLSYLHSAVDIGEYRRAWQLARGSWQFLFFAGYSDDLIAAMSLGLTAARAAADERGVALMNNYLASGYYRIGNYSGADRCLLDALEYSIRTDDRSTEARIRSNRCGPLNRLGRYAEAFTETVRSYAIYRELDHPEGLAVRLVDRSTHLMLAGRNPEALTWARRALQSAVEIGHSFLLSVALLNVGQARLRLGAVEPAKRLLTAALRLTEQLGYQANRAEIINELGRVATAQGQYAEAVNRHLAARRIMQEQGERRGVAFISNDLAVALRASGDTAGALEVHRHALELARQLQQRHEQGRALAGIGACLSDDDPVGAHRAWRQALEIFTRLKLPERFDVQRRLNGGEYRLQAAFGGGTMGT